MTVRAEEVSYCSEIFRITMRGIKLANKDFLSKSDPFFAISRLREDGQWQQVCLSYCRNRNRWVRRGMSVVRVVSEGVVRRTVAGVCAWVCGCAGTNSLLWGRVH